jgi:hypothetical protein
MYTKIQTSAAHIEHLDPLATGLWIYDQEWVYRSLIYGMITDVGSALRRAHGGLGRGGSRGEGSQDGWNGVEVVK